MHLVLIALLAQTLPTTDPTSDPTSDWLLNQTPTAHAAPAPATQPASVFATTAAPATTGSLTLSDGTALTGGLTTTPGKPLRFWAEEDKRYIDVPLDQLATLEVDVLWERDEAEWQFAASGQDQKVYTGRTYPARETAYHVTLQNGDTFVGSVAAPITVATATGEQTFVLHKRDKGDVGVPVAKLVYVKKVSVDAGKK